MNLIWRAPFVFLYWLFSLPQHFQAQWFVVGCMCALCSLPFSQFLVGKAGLATGLLTAVISGLRLAPYLRISSKSAELQQPDLSSNSKFKVLHLNVQICSHSYKELSEIIINEKPDFICLNEVSDDWFQDLEKTGAVDEYAHTHRRSNCFIFFKEHHVMLLSKFPFEKLDVFYGKPKEEQDATIVATCKITGGQLVKVAAMHPRVPLSPFYFARQLHHFHMLGQMPEEFAAAPTVMMGDMNTSPWLPSFQKMCRRLSMRDARREKRMLLNTWPAPLQFFGIPIDFVLVNERIDVEELRAGPHVGSDHLPLIATLSIRENKRTL